MLCPFKYGLARLGFEETGHQCCDQASAAFETGCWDVKHNIPCRFGYDKKEKGNESQSIHAVVSTSNTDLQGQVSEE